MGQGNRWRHVALFIQVILIVSCGGGGGGGATPAPVSVANTKTIMMIGDSITAGITPYMEEVGLRIDNEGLSGNTVKEEKTAILGGASYKPDIIIVMLGINDINGHFGQDATKERYIELINNIRKVFPASILYVQSILPMTHGVQYDYAAGNILVNDLNAWLNIQSGPYGFFFINHHDKFIDPTTGEMNELYTVDGVHLSPEGYRLLCSILMDAI